MGTTDNREPKRTVKAAGRIVRNRTAKRSFVDCQEDDENDFDIVVKIKKNTINMMELYLCSGNGSNGEDFLLSLLFDYLDFKNASICSMVCKRFRNNITQSYWPKAEKKLNIIDAAVLSSPSARNSMERVIRYRNASEEATRIAGTGDLISKHIVVPSINESGMMDYVRVSDCCSGCDFFPQQLNFDVIGFDDYNMVDRDDNYELFVRFSRTIDNFLFSEGFLEYPDIDLDRFDFSKWHKIIEITTLVETEGENLTDLHKEKLMNCMKELTITVVAVHKTTARVDLVLAQCNFGIVDIMDDQGFCWTKGKLSAKSHGPIQTIQDYAGDRENIESEGALGMIFTYLQYEDPDNEDQQLPPVCSWNLNIDIDFRVTTHSSSDDNSNDKSNYSSETGYDDDRDSDDY